MKFRDLDGQFKDIVVKTGDTLPVGSVVEYEGSTPPAGWSKLSDGGSVIVSSEEPTTGEEVWFERGKNLYNPANAQTQGNNSQNILLKYEKIKVGETYTFSAPYTWVTINIHNSSNQIVRIFGNIENSYEQTFTIQDGEKYFTVMFYSGMNNVNLANFDFTNVQLERGEEATSYEPFIPKKIHTNTGNGYEEFYNIAPTVITPTLESIVKSGQITAIKSGNVVVVEVSDLMLNSDRKEWNTTVATGLPKPLFFSGAWRKSTLLENKGLLQIGNSGEVTICTRTGTQSTSDCYIGQITYITEE